MTKEDQVLQAAQFRALHHEPTILLLPNVWDVVSAKLYEVDGFSAVGTTSAGIATSLGFPDGQRIGVRETAEVVERIAARVSIPISADIEAGYADSPDGIADAARAVLRAGAVGINIEDSLSGCGIDHYASLFDVSVQSDRIRAIRAMADKEGVGLVVNARTDVFLAGAESQDGKIGEAVRRGNAYLDAGADCVFVPDMGNLDREAIRALVARIDGPINVIAGENTPPIPDLEAIGVARLSFGPRPMRAALALLRAIGREWLEAGTYSRMNESALSYAEVNGWFA